MTDERFVKQAKGKLYNLKNGIEGLIPLLDSGVITIDRLGDAIGSLAAKAIEDCKNLEVPPV